ncbi:Uncharacterized conserved protein, DUF885 familyt [Jatrophihabitans endophyticus]|uniref:Uncharacterized conserved protein, DUF885 familyt n=1 Tax=Jatrophihabitans endophyticus TaxID=1206085 RepID=A0A1M5HP28_9ACTN|nr:DUF885 domain-containing protein [Jatrophihabitans endophyticus]SHG17582.1 Uncharacterized conserved protein, DUF885 familyt [Jatrophihabitans endophyticus]
MTSPAPSARAIADRLATVLLEAEPFVASGLGLREYDALVPDPSRAAADELDRRLREVAAEVAALPAEATRPGSPERITAAAVAAVCERTRLELAARESEYTVTAMPYVGPPAALATAARTVLVDDRAAADYLTRLRSLPDWIDGTAARLDEGAAAGCFPVASLVESAVAWADRTLAEGVPAAFTAAVPADASAAWRAELEAVVTGAVVPSLRSWRDRVAALLSRSRPDDAAGLWALPDGAAAYRRAVAVHTTLPYEPQELHRIGLAEVARLERRAVELGAELGLHDLAAVVRAVRESSGELAPEAALRRAREAVARAEERAGEIMPAPLPAPCAVEPMPTTVAQSGMAPHYSRPRADGSRPGTYWFNTQRPSAGAGWDLEAVAFHETVPGHHSQLARAAILPDLPLLQQLSITVHAEGWGLYAERLADEFGLLSDVRAQLGAVYIEMHRAARLVVDTGLHALRWTRQQARDYLIEHVALPEQFLLDEVDRYIARPGQALAYQAGLREIVRLRAHAEDALAAAFDLPGFNAALVDSGSVTMPVLALVVDDWIAARR